MFDGKCAYCGLPLGKLWNVDHRVPVLRTWRDDETVLLRRTRGGNDEGKLAPGLYAVQPAEGCALRGGVPR